MDNIEEVMKNGNIEKITELFVNEKFNGLGKSEVRRLFTNSEIDPIECLLLVNKKIDWEYGINFPDHFYSYIIEELPQLLLEKIETLPKEDIEILVWLGVDYHLSVDQILSLTDDVIEKYLEAYFETRWDYFDGDDSLIEKFQNRFGTKLSKHFRRLIEERIVVNDQEEVSSIYYDGWLELIKKKDLRDLLENDNLHFLDRLVAGLDYDYSGFTPELHQFIFNHILSTLPPVEIRAIVELQDLLNQRINYVVDVYYEGDFPGIKVQNNHVVALNLSSCDLKSLPDSIGYLARLEDLDLCSNELTELPETISNLKNLKELNIGHNNLVRIPNSIGKLTNLERLWIGDNNIMELPETIWGLKKLKPVDSDFFDTPGLEATALTKIYRLKYIENQKEGRQNITFDKAFKLYLAKHELSELGDQITDLRKFKIRTDIKYMKVHDKYMESGLSKFGGNPDVPRNFKWPNWNGEPLDFLLQINLSDLKHFDFAQMPYDEGMLYVFYHTTHHNINDNGSWRIIYTSEKDLIRMSNPVKSTEEVFKSGGITFFKDISLPTPWNQAVEDIISNWKERNSYKNLYNELFTLNFHRTSHWMFGYPHELAGPGMEVKVELASNNIEVLKFDEIGKNSINQLKEDNWILLLVISSDYRPGWNWAEGGRLYFWITKDDLQQGKFENVWMIAERPRTPETNYPKVDFKSVKQLKGEWFQTPLEGISLTLFQIRTFLNELAGENGCQYTGLKWECGGKDFEISRKILNLMKIPKEEQEKFLEKCKEHGGFCDCEILMNAASHLLGEDTPW